MCAITVLSSKSYLKFIDVADNLIKDFLEGCIQIYGIDSISSNFHNLCHLIEDVKNFGSLPEISSYPFENYLGQMKRLIRSGKAPLIQLAKRTKELSFLTTQQNVNKTASVFCKNEIKSNLSTSNKKTYNTVHFAEEFLLNNTDKDSWFLTKEGHIASMQYATYQEGNVCVYASQLKETNNFFVTPFQSSQLKIFESTAALHGNNYKPIFIKTKKFFLKEIRCKLFSLQYKNKFVYLPILHTLDVSF